ncbi:hypothetical protein PAPHI01_1037 [Pancytospora philotis]|nr:hypothetical protein PAPHI01_1037 [Pancytospora philotis]
MPTDKTRTSKFLGNAKFTHMDRKSQILAPTSKVGGVRRPHRAAAPKKDSVATAIDAMKSELAPTILKTCSYKSEGNIVSYENAKIHSILGKNKKHVCFLVSGTPSSISEGEALKNIPDSMKSSLGGANAGASGSEGIEIDSTTE